MLSGLLLFLFVSFSFSYKSPGLHSQNIWWGPNTLIIASVSAPLVFGFVFAFDFGQGLHLPTSLS